MDQSSHQVLETAGARSASHSAALSRLFSRLWEATKFPPQAMQLLSVSPEALQGDASEGIVPIIEADPVIASRVRRRVNSPQYGLSEAVTDLSQASARLGHEELTNIALTAAIGRLYSIGDAVAKTGGYQRDELWSYSVGIALIADRLAQLGERVERRVAFAAGLLHDIGYLLLEQHLRPHYLRFAALARHRAQEPFQVTDLEEQIFTFNHASLGGYVAVNWGLPGPLCEAIEHHHRFEKYKGGSRELLATLVLADWLAAERDWTALGLPRPNDNLENVIEAANLTPAALDEVRGHVPQLLDQVPAVASLR